MADHLSNGAFELQFIPWLELYYVLAHQPCWVAFHNLHNILDAELWQDADEAVESLQLYHVVYSNYPIKLVS